MKSIDKAINTVIKTVDKSSAVKLSVDNICDSAENMILFCYRMAVLTDGDMKARIPLFNGKNENDLYFTFKYLNESEDYLQKCGVLQESIGKEDRERRLTNFIKKYKALPSKAIENIVTSRTIISDILYKDDLFHNLFPDLITRHIGDALSEYYPGYFYGLVFLVSIQNIMEDIERNPAMPTYAIKGKLDTCLKRYQPKDNQSVEADFFNVLTYLRVLQNKKTYSLFKKYDEGGNNYLLKYFKNSKGENLGEVLGFYQKEKYGSLILYYVKDIPADVKLENGDIIKGFKINSDTVVFEMVL